MNMLVHIVQFTYATLVGKTLKNSIFPDTNVVIPFFQFVFSWYIFPIPLFLTFWVVLPGLPLKGNIWLDF